MLASVGSQKHTIRICRIQVHWASGFIAAAGVSDGHTSGCGSERRTTTVLFDHDIHDQFALYGAAVADLLAQNSNAAEVCENVTQGAKANPGDAIEVVQLVIPPCQPQELRSEIQR
mmetsp:Transcript_23129/g.48179  ORF Transcript_23129/g.48179 Transcript_23129/m.48179 type:complete len:116 (+) Transcript_23129:163-510(+)